MLELLSLITTFDAFLALCVLVFVGPVIYSRGRSPSNLPPGPPGHFLIGHALKIPVEYQWRTFAEWGETYGINKALSFPPMPISFFNRPGRLIYIHVFGRPVIICNSLDIARELLEKRSHNYSDRPRMMSGELWVLHPCAVRLLTQVYTGLVWGRWWRWWITGIDGGSNADSCKHPLANKNLLLFDRTSRKRSTSLS